MRAKYGSLIPRKEGNAEADSNALADMSNAIREAERRGLSNETIARVIIQSTPNAKTIAKIIVEL